MGCMTGSATPRVPVLPIPGDLLVASVGSKDPNFADAVVLMIECDDNGAVGLVLNQYAPLDLAQVLPQWVDAVAPPQVLFRGGPVAPETAMCVARIDSGVGTPIGWRRLFADVGLLDLDTPPAAVANRYQALRIFAGYAGWGAGQLAAELLRGLWYVVPFNPDDVFSESPDTLWRSVLRRVRGEIAFFSTWTDDPAQN